MTGLPTGAGLPNLRGLPDPRGIRGAGVNLQPAPHTPLTGPSVAGQRTSSPVHTENSGLIELHQSIAALLASRGEWQQAYHHLRSALDLLEPGTESTVPTTAAPEVEDAEPYEEPFIPEQLRDEVDRLRKEHAEAREQSLRDSLTHSYNRRYLDQRLVSLLTEGHEHYGGMALALVDLDWFKQVNDTYGHPVGDRVLQQVVDLLQEGLPTSGFCARYGGEEFVLVMPSVDARTAIALCETARARVERFPWHQIQPGLRVTISIGLSYETPPDDTQSMSAEQQLLSADSLLYTAKGAGRNAVAYQTDGGTRLAGKAGQRRGIR